MRVTPIIIVTSAAIHGPFTRPVWLDHLATIEPLVSLASLRNHTLYT